MKALTVKLPGLLFYKKSQLSIDFIAVFVKYLGNDFYSVFIYNNSCKEE